MKRGFEAICGCGVVEGYGLSETSPVVTCNPVEAVREGSIGLPLPATEISIRSLDDPAVRRCRAASRARSASPGPQVMTGYWNKPQETEGSFVGRYFRTGDVGYMDEDGYIFIVDRIKDMINASGFKVYPRRIEDALYEHGAVAEVTVVGIPDEYRGEAPKAFVKLKEGKQATDGGAAPVPEREAVQARAAGRDRVPRSAAEDHGRQAVEKGTPRGSEALIRSAASISARDR